MPSNPRRTRRSLGASLVVLAAVLAPAPAFADEVVADLAARTPVSAYGGALAWSAYDAPSQRYRLVIRQGAETVAARTAASRRAFDVSLGPDAKGRVVALYTRCRTAAKVRTRERNCDVYRYDLRTRREHKLASVSSPALDEAWPAQWRDRVTFARRARTHVVDGFDHRPDPRGRGPLLDCDIPYVKTLSSRAPSRRLDRSQCGSTDGMAIRGTTIVHVTGVNQGGAGSESQVRLLRAGGGAAKLLARAGGGEGGYSPFRSPSLSASAVWLTRTGRREGVQQGFLRIDLASRRLTTVPANLNLAGSIARDERGTFWYVQGPEPDFDGESTCGLALEPCRLVRASASPFSQQTRVLLARLRVAAPASRMIFAFASDPLVLTGDLTRTVVRGGAIVAHEPVPGVAVALLRTARIEVAGPFATTGLTATTDAAGRWSFALPTPPPAAVFAIFAPSLRVASEAVSLQVSSKIELRATGASLAGTVAPAQPGRIVEVQRLAVDAQGLLPDGRRVCVQLPGGKLSCGDDAWATYAQAPLDAAGTAFSTTVAQPGDYRARLSFEVDPQGRATAYGGLSPEVHVAP
jgi:hypothetical protein